MDTPDPSKPDQHPKGPLQVPSTLAAAGPLLTLGWTIAGSVLVGVFGGIWLDGKFGTKPWLTVVGALFGIAAANVELFKSLRPPKPPTE